MPVLARYRRPLLAQVRFAGAGLICGGTDPDRRAITTLLVSALGSEQLSDSWLALPHADGSHAARAATAPLDVMCTFLRADNVGGAGGAEVVWGD